LSAAPPFIHCWWVRTFVQALEELHERLGST